MARTPSSVARTSSAEAWPLAFAAIVGTALVLSLLARALS